jgi:hypothetical protein
VLADIGRNPVGAVDDTLTVGNFLFTVDEDGAFAPKFVYHKAIVDDFLADVDGRTKSLERDTHHVDSPDHARAEPSRL